MFAVIIDEGNGIFYYRGWISQSRYFYVVNTLTPSVIDLKPIPTRRQTRPELQHIRTLLEAE
jgi:hypothetical protein